MKMVVKTEPFKVMVQKAAAGASQDKLLPITSLICIQLAQGVLTLTTTDTSNTLQVKTTEVAGDELYAVVPVDIFSKLVAKTTSEAMSLSVDGSTLMIHGNGDYTIGLCEDEDGIVEFPTYKFKKSKEAEIVKLAAVKNVLAVNKASVCKTIDSPHLWAYHSSDMVTTTDEQTICFNKSRLSSSDILISAEMMDLLGLFVSEDISFYKDKGYFLFETPNLVLHGPEHSGKDKFPVENLKQFLDMSFPYTCKVSKSKLQSVMDRLALFIEPYDKNGAYFTFTKSAVLIKSKRCSSVEEIAYTATELTAPFVCCVDIPLLQQQISSIQSEAVDIWYGHPSAIKLCSDNDKVIQVIALLQDENLEANSGN